MSTRPSSAVAGGLLWRAPLIALLAAALAGLLRWAAGELPALTERLYSRGVFPLIRTTLTSVSALLPISLGELTLVALAVFAVVRTVLAVRALRRGESKASELLVRGVARAVTLGGWLYVAYLLVWGLNYARLPYAAGTALDARPAGVDELVEATLEFAERAAQLRSELPEDADGVVRIERDWPRHWEAIAAAWEAAARDDERLAGPRPALRAALCSPLLTASGIGGIYWPFTAESHVNVEPHPVQVLFSGCHEVAHARGFAREDEANFLAWLIASRSDRREIAYAGALMAFRSLHARLISTDFHLGLDLYDHIARPLLRDGRAIEAFWTPTSKVQRSVQNLSEAVNDTFLKSQGQKLGVRSYGRMVDLLLAERRKRAAQAAAASNTER